MNGNDFEVWHKTKGGLNLLTISPRQLGIQKEDCFLQDFLKQMVIHRLSFVPKQSFNDILCEIIELKKIKEGEELLLFENSNNNYYYANTGYKIFKRKEKEYICPKDIEKDTLILVDDLFILQKVS